jgi:hypothetical protein
MDERPTGVLLQNQSIEMAKEGVPLVDLESDEREARNQEATKVDDAKVPVYLWDGRVAKIRAKQLGRELDSTFRKRLVKASNLLRATMLRYWQRRVEESFWDWYSKEKKWFEDQGKEPPLRNLGLDWL